MRNAMMGAVLCSVLWSGPVFAQGYQSEALVQTSGIECVPAYGPTPEVQYSAESGITATDWVDVICPLTRASWDTEPIAHFFSNVWFYNQPQDDSLINYCYLMYEDQYNGEMYDSGTFTMQLLNNGVQVMSWAPDPNNPGFPQGQSVGEWLYCTLPPYHSILGIVTSQAIPANQAGVAISAQPPYPTY
jgi:hypothetical protein